jgi:hypothetical protein
MNAEMMHVMPTTEHRYPGSDRRADAIVPGHRGDHAWPGTCYERYEE